MLHFTFYELANCTMVSSVNTPGMNDEFKVTNDAAFFV